MQRAIRVAVVLIIFTAGVFAQREGVISGIFSQWGDIVFLSRQHVILAAISGACAIVVGVPIGIVLSRPAMRRVAESIMQVLNIGTTIPTLAILALAMSFLGIGDIPSLFALWVATLLPIARNTYAGLLAVPSHLIEASTGMGMRSLQILWRVELPNALFVIFAGIRTAMAINIGTVPLAFLIGGGGLGQLIFTGIALDDTMMMLAGAIATAVLAVLTDFLIGQIQYWFVPRGVNPLR